MEVERYKTPKEAIRVPSIIDVFGEMTMLYLWVVLGTSPLYSRHVARVLYEGLYGMASRLKRLVDAR